MSLLNACKSNIQFLLDLDFDLLTVSLAYNILNGHQAVASFLSTHNSWGFYFKFLHTFHPCYIKLLFCYYIKNIDFVSSQLMDQSVISVSFFFPDFSKLA